MVGIDIEPARLDSFAREVLPKLDGVEGWLTDGQAATLYDAAARCPDGGRIVEIGSFRGRSTIVLASAAGPGVEIVAIDPHAGNDRGPQEITGFEQDAATDNVVFEANLARAGVRDRVRHVRAFSDAAHGEVHDSIHVLFIDGAHRYAPARADIRDWGARVERGGDVLIHDSFSSIGVTLAILRELAWSKRMRYVGRSRSLAAYRVDLDGGTSARLRNAGRQVLELGWFARNLALKVALTLGLGKLLKAAGRTPPEWPY